MKAATPLATLQGLDCFAMKYKKKRNYANLAVTNALNK